MLNHNNIPIPEYETSFDEVMKNINFYINSFKNDGILIFKKINISEQQQVQLLKKMGDICNWYPNSTVDMYTKYIENHTNLLKKTKGCTDRMILEYHLECMNYQEPQHAGIWNMIKFKCSRDSGKTSFINSTYILNQLPQEYVDFLRRASILHIHSGIYRPESLHYPHPALMRHPLTNAEILRIDYKLGKFQKLFSINNQLPSKKDVLLFDNIILDICNIIYARSESDDVWYSWDEGDVIIPDLLLMYHAVSGGFDFNEREFIGYWSFPAKTESIEQFVDDKHLMAN